MLWLYSTKSLNESNESLKHIEDKKLTSNLYLFTKRKNVYEVTKTKLMFCAYGLDAYALCTDMGGRSCGNRHND